MRKRRVATGILVLAGAVIWVTWAEKTPRASAIPAAAEGGGGAVTAMTACADANGDGIIDLADPVFLLNHLFAGGQSPMCRTGPLPATGQTECFTGNGVPIACIFKDQVWGEQDGLYQTGCPVNGRFVDNQDGTVTDNCTGLMWEKNTDRNGDGRVTAPDRMSWQAGLQFCESLVLTGQGTWLSRMPGETPQQFAARVDPVMDLEGVKYDDWRMPNVTELFSLLSLPDTGVPAGTPEVDATLRPLDTDASFHSSTTSPRNKAQNLIVYHGGATSDTWVVERPKADLRPVRAVRSAK